MKIKRDQMLNKKNVFQIVILFLGLFFGHYPSNAQDICIFDEQKVSSLEGIVLSKQEGIPQVNLELLEKKNEKKTDYKVQTDDSGNYSFPKIPKGKYILVVSRELFASVRIPIRIVSEKSEKKSQLLIRMVPDFMDPCEGDVTVKHK